MNKNDPKLASRRAVSARRSCRRRRGARRPRPARAESNPANLPPNVADWTKMLGEGVAARPYGKPRSTRSTSSAATCRG